MAKDDLITLAQTVALTLVISGLYTLFVEDYVKNIKTQWEIQRQNIPG